MVKKILVISDKEKIMHSAFVIQKEKMNEKLLAHIYEKSYLQLCVIDTKMKVEEILYLVGLVRHFFSIPICVFESNVIQRFPGDIDNLKGHVDLFIRNKFEAGDFYSLVQILLFDSKRINEEAEITSCGDKISVCPAKRETKINQSQISLTRIEFDIFYYLLKKQGDVVPYKELYEMVWKKEYLHDDTNIMAHIHRLRGKVEKDPKKPRYICNQYGVGYYFGNVLQN